MAPNFESWQRVMDATCSAEADYMFTNFGWEQRGVSSADPEWEAEARDYLIEKVEAAEYGEQVPGTTAARILGIAPSGTVDHWTVAVSMARNGWRPQRLTEVERLSVTQIGFRPFEPEAPPAESAQRVLSQRDHFTLEELLAEPELLKRGELTSRVFCREELSLLAAREKAGKTTLAVWDLVEATRQGTPAMLVSFEEALPRIVTRFRAMGARPTSHILSRCLARWPASRS